jgi:hypothetical protein
VVPEGASVPHDWFIVAEDFILKITALILLGWTAWELIKKKMGL